MKLTDHPLGSEVMLDGETYGLIQCWIRSDGVDGACIYLAKDYRVKAEVKPGLVMTVTHAFLPDELPARFTMRHPAPEPWV